MSYCPTGICGRESSLEGVLSERGLHLLSFIHVLRSYWHRLVLQKSHTRYPKTNVLHAGFCLGGLRVGFFGRQGVGMHCVSASPENTVVTCHCCHRGAAQSAPDWQNRYLVDRSRMIYRRMTWSRCAVSICHAANGLTYVWLSRTHSRADQGLHYVIFGNVCVSTSKYETMRIHFKVRWQFSLYARDQSISHLIVLVFLHYLGKWKKRISVSINNSFFQPYVTHYTYLVYISESFLFVVNVRNVPNMREHGRLAVAFSARQLFNNVLLQSAP